MTSGTAAFNLSPNSNVSPRLATEADAWAHFRVRQFKFRIYPDPVAANAGDQAAGYIGGVQDTAPTTVTQVVELISSVFLSGGQTVPTEWCHLNRAEMSGPFSWYKTVAGGADSQEEFPGQFCLAGAGTDAYRIEMRGVFEFKVAVATANTPEEVELHRRLHELRIQRSLNRQRERLQDVLSVSAPYGSAVSTRAPPPSACLHRKQ